MNSQNSHTLPLIITSLIMSFLFFMPSLCLAEDAGNDMSLSQEISMVQGKVVRFNPEKQTLTVKTSKGERKNILLNWNTAFVGYSSAQEITKDHGVKVWYTVDERKNTAVKIEKKIDTGC